MNYLLYFIGSIICVGLYLFFINQFNPDVTWKEKTINSIKIFFLYPVYILVWILKEFF